MYLLNKKSRRLLAGLGMSISEQQFGDEPQPDVVLDATDFLAVHEQHPIGDMRPVTLPLHVTGPMWDGQHDVDAMDILAVLKLTLDEAIPIRHLIEPHINVFCYQYSSANMIVSTRMVSFGSLGSSEPACIAWS